MYKLICIQRNSRFEEKSISSSVIQNEQTECEFMAWSTGSNVDQKAFSSPKVWMTCCFSKF